MLCFLWSWNYKEISFFFIKIAVQIIINHKKAKQKKILRKYWLMHSWEYCKSIREEQFQNFNSISCVNSKGYCLICNQQNFKAISFSINKFRFHRLLSHIHKFSIAYLLQSIELFVLKIKTWMKLCNRLIESSDWNCIRSVLYCALLLLLEWDCCEPC